MGSRFPFSASPNGWYCIAYSSELPIGAVQSLHYFGEELVLFRTADGLPHVLDAYCSHLGANLGHGGYVKGQTIRCPFHDLAFNGDGHCTNTAYCEHSQANLRSWVVSEIDGMIFVYYDSQGEPPNWEIPSMTEYDSAEWLPFRPVFQRKVRTHVQEMCENAFDINHFAGLHSIQLIEHKTISNTGPVWQEFYRLQSLDLVGRTSFLINMQGVNSSYNLAAYGLGYAVNRIQSKVALELLNLRVTLEPNLLVRFMPTPIDENYSHLRVDASAKKMSNPLLTRFIASSLFKSLKEQVFEDIYIWEHKAYFSQPSFLKTDGKLVKCREWTSQFYPAEQKTSKVSV